MGNSGAFTAGVWGKVYNKTIEFYISARYNQIMLRFGIGEHCMPSLCANNSGIARRNPDWRGGKTLTEVGK